MTLFDLLVTLGIAGVIAASAAPQAAKLLGGLELRSGALQLASALLRARLAALAEARPWVVRVVDGRSFEVGALEATAVREALPGRVRFARTTSGGEVRFSPSGWAENATFTLARDERQRAVAVNQRGRLTLRDEADAS